VGGLIFSSHWNFTRWRVAREEGHRLYFRAVFWGAVIFALVAIARHYVEGACPLVSGAAKYLKAIIEPLAKDKAAGPAVADLTITCFIAMLSAWPLAKLLNFAFPERKWIRRAIEKDDLEKLLLRAADEEFPICVTMDDKKVYVGYLVEGFDPALGRKSILILPLMSGYRDPETHKVNFTTFYAYLYGQRESMDRTAPLPAPLDHLTAEDFITVLPVDRITSYRLFDVPAYNEFQKHRPP
jgi:hypothetical protein